MLFRKIVVVLIIKIVVMILVMIIQLYIYLQYVYYVYTGLGPYLALLSLLVTLHSGSAWETIWGGRLAT